MKRIYAILLLVVALGCGGKSTGKTATVCLTGKPEVGQRIHYEGRWWTIKKVAVNGSGGLFTGGMCHYCELVADEEETGQTGRTAK